MTEIDQSNVFDPLEFAVYESCGKIVWVWKVFGKDDCLVIRTLSRDTSVKNLGLYRIPTTEDEFNSLVHEIQLLLLFES